MKRLTILFFFILLSCSKDSPVPDAVVPTPSVTKFTLVVAASEGGSVDTSGGTYNENSNVTVTAAPAEGYVFSGWTGNASGSTNPLTVSINGDKNITATFSRNQYALNVGVVGQGSVDQELVSSAKSKTDYDSGSTVRLTATPETGWLFYKWEGLTTDGNTEEAEVNSTNPVDVAISQSVNTTATFEQIITETDNPTSAVGKWKIRKKKVASKANKTALVECGLTDIIFRADGSFSIITSTTTITGQFVFDGNTTINLTQSQSPFGTITNLVLTNSFISFSIDLVSGCDDDLDGDRDDDYDESNDVLQNCNEQDLINLLNSLKDINIGDVKEFSFGDYYLTMKGESTPLEGTFQGITYRQFVFNEVNELNGLGNEISFYFGKDSGDLLFIISLNRILQNGVKTLSQIRRFYAPNYISDGALNYEHSSYCELWNAASNFTNDLPKLYNNKAYVPDDNFEQALIFLGYDDILDNYVNKNNVSEIDILDLRNMEISDMTGIEAFTSITRLNLFNNELTSIDISNNLNIKSLILSLNSITALDVTKNTKLEELYISDNNISYLDLSNNILLTQLYAGENLLTELDVSNNNMLRELNLAGDMSNGGSNSSNRNRITNIDLSNNNDLRYLSLSLLGIEGTIDISNLVNLIGLVITGNPNLTSIDLSNNRELQWISAGFNGRLNGLDLTNQSKLAFLSLRAVGQSFSDLDVSNNNKLVIFDTTNWYDTSVSKCIKVSQYQIDNQITNNSINGETTDFTVWFSEGSGQGFSSVDWTKDENDSYQLSCSN